MMRRTSVLLIIFDGRESNRLCIKLHGESAERGRESPFCVQSVTQAGVMSNTPACAFKASILFDALK